MSINDPIGDMLTRIRNGQMRGKEVITSPCSRLRLLVLDVLKGEGYIRGYTVTKFDGGKSDVDIELKYYDGKPVIRKINRVSKPGRRVYASVASIPPVANGLGVSIISTPKGVLADWQAREHNVGGEVLCQVF